MIAFSLRADGRLSVIVGASSSESRSLLQACYWYPFSSQYDNTFVAEVVDKYFGMTSLLLVIS